MKNNEVILKLTSRVCINAVNLLDQLESIMKYFALMWNSY